MTSIGNYAFIKSRGIQAIARCPRFPSNVYECEITAL
jgi:hypothetical protein